MTDEVIHVQISPNNPRVYLPCPIASGVKEIAVLDCVLPSTFGNVGPSTYVRASVSTDVQDGGPKHALLGRKQPILTTLRQAIKYRRQFKIKFDGERFSVHVPHGYTMKITDTLSDLTFLPQKLKGRVTSSQPVTNSVWEGTNKSQYIHFYKRIQVSKKFRVPLAIYSSKEEIVKALRESGLPETAPIPTLPDPKPFFFVFLCCNAVQPSRVGGKELNVLKMFPSAPSSRLPISTQEHYKSCSLTQSEINCLEFSLVNEHGEPVIYQGSIFLSLLLRRDM